MIDFVHTMPLLMPHLSGEDKACLRTYFSFYAPHRHDFSDWMETELLTHPGWGDIIKNMGDEERLAQRETSYQAQVEAIFNDNWEPYLRQLQFFGVFYARIGMTFYSWFEIINMLRRYLTPFLLKNKDVDEIVTIMVGMDQYLDIVMSNIGEAYLYEKKRIIENQKQEQEQLNKELESFVYIASHDLQEPLNTITSFAGLLEEEFGNQFTGEALECLSYIKASSSRMSELITGLLDYSKVAREGKFHSLPIEKLLQDVLGDLKGRIVQKNANIEVLGPLPEIPVFPMAIKLLFQNLLSNALKFHNKDVPPVVRISAEKEEGCYHFVVNDNGIGIDPKHKDKIFVIFRRLHNSTEYEGTGIGLAHCKKIVEAHGGKIWVESTPGMGSEFHFTLCDKQIKHEVS